MNTWGKRWAAVLFCMAAGCDAGAAMSQVPLSGSIASVSPNLMFTLDDSGSMFYECIPDAICTMTGTEAYAIPWYKGSGEGAQSFVTYGSDSLLARRLRSASINPLYYNPKIRYRPWMKADGTRMPQYPVTAAPTDPSYLSVTANLVSKQTLTLPWIAELVMNFDRSMPSAETFWPAQYYELNAGKAGTSLGDFTQVIISSATTSYPKGPDRTDCAGSTCTYEEEAQNFSNWFTYARNRLKVARGGTSEAFLAVPSTFRVGFGEIGSTTPRDIDGVLTKTILMGVRPFTPANREKFYNLLQGTWFANGTPLRRALDDVGQYFSRTDSRSPWASDPENGETSSAHQSCRRSFNVLMTDGMWGGDTIPTAGASTDVDNTEGPVIENADKTKPPYQYKPAAPYRGQSIPSLADVAMYYWSRDLRPDLKNDVPVTSSDPAFWQHLVNYTIGFGVNGQLRNPEDWQGLAAGTIEWSKPASDTATTANVDDLWHAAVNSRGTTASARSAGEYTNALKSMIETIVATSGSEAGVAVSGRSYSPTTAKYIPSYKSGDWTGEVEARQLSDGSTLWHASKQLPAAADRKIFTLQDGAGVPFTSTGMSTTTQALLGSTDPERLKRLIGYLRGERTEEQNGYRKRISVLGDIVNSSPVLVKDLVDGQYDFLSTTTPGQSSYLRYLSSKKYRSAQLFVGANDGMLHAFNADTGVESFAFVPRSILGQIQDLAHPLYSHRYFVDGPLTEVDVYDGTDSKWRNLVIGTGGAGAKNLFAINVPVPTMPTSGTPTALTAAQSAPGASDIRWEISSSDADYTELGHVLQPPEAGILQDGTWAIITGNGYDSASKKAQLYVIDARTGARIAVLDTGWGYDGWPNGLGGVKLVRDSNQRIMYAYAGDLYGSFWKFDLSSTTRSDWKIAFGKTPLFWAKTSTWGIESITAAPAVLPHPRGGFMVFVGTGKLLESADASSTDEQSLYGVWDRVPLGANTSSSSDNVGYGWTAATHNTSLVTHTITPLTIDGKSGDYFAISNETVDYGTTGGMRGWKIRMTIAPGQRMIYAPQIESGRVLFDTIVPGGTANSCKATQAQGYTFVLDPFTGAPGRDGPTFDTNNDGQFTSADSATAAVTHFSSIGPRQIVGIPSTPRVRFEGPGPTGDDSSKTVNLGGTPVRRQWRQIVTPPPY